MRIMLVLLAVAVLLIDSRAARGAAQARYVIHISVDGLGSNQLEALLNSKKLPSFQRLLREGASTFNARTDPDFTVTLPNHSAMLTGRTVRGPDGHRYEENGSPAEDVTLHSNAKRYIASVFDVAHDNNLRTGLYASKSKFVVFDVSFDAESGAVDSIAPDNGRDKIDVYRNLLDTDKLLTYFLSDMRTQPNHYSFFHFNDPDRAGHAHGWGSPPYLAAVANVDAKLARILAAIDATPALKGKTWIVLTADHGGTGISHGDVRAPAIFRIPLIVWSSSGGALGDLYALNAANSADPGTKHPRIGAPGLPPLRNGDTGNCVLGILGLQPVPGSRLNALIAPCG